MGMTRKDALALAISSVENEEAIETLSKMLNQLNNPKRKTNGKTVARKENEAIAQQLANIVEKGESIDSTFVMAHTTAMTTQKVVGIMKVAEELGFFTKQKIGKKVTYLRV